MWIFNGRAVIALLTGIAAAICIMVKIENRGIALIAGIVVAMGVDVWMRFQDADSDRPMIDPDAGGHIWFAPVWLVGVIFMAIVGLAYFNVV